MDCILFASLNEVLEMKKLNKISVITKNVVNKSISFCKKNATTILSCISSAGVVLTGVSAAYSARRAYKKELSKFLDNWELDKKDLSLSEKVKIIFPYCITPTLIGATTIVCIFGTNTISKKQQAAYIGAYVLLQNTFNEYRKKADELYGKGSDETIKSSVRQDKYASIELKFTGEKQVFYEEHRNEFFELSIEEVMSAEYHINRNLALRGYVSLNEFYEFLGLSPITSGDILGWDLNVGGQIYGYTWIDFNHKKYVLDDGLEYYLIEYPFPPHPEDSEYEQDLYFDCNAVHLPQLANYA